MAKIRKINDGYILFDDGSRLYSDHCTQCCEEHYLAFYEMPDKNADQDIYDLEFDLNPDGRFFERVENYGIRLVPTNGYPVFIPGYASNNGYYSDKLTLVLCRPTNEEYKYDITDCQDWNNY